MGSLRLLLNHQNRFVTIAVASLLVIMVPILASAAQITERSIELSNSSKAMTGVTYEVNFTAVGSATGFVIDFCANTPLIGQSCTAPEGLDVSAATVTGGDVAKNTVDTTASMLVGTKEIGAGTQTITLTGVKNPDDAGVMYARILTFNDDDEEDYASGAPGAFVDSGSVALSITDTIGVSGAVLETMTFCVAGDSGTVNTNNGIDNNCSDVAGNAPTLALGEDNGGVVALTSTALSTGDIYAQISTNAVNGAIVRLKSDAPGCGGLLRAGDLGKCDIKPALTGDTIAAGQAKFGLIAAAADAPVSGSTPTGTFQPAGTYNGSTYEFNYVTGDGTGVTSVYGDPILNTNGAPANNQNMKLTFGASVSNETPAGLYSTDLSLIATGTF